MNSFNLWLLGSTMLIAQQNPALYAPAMDSILSERNQRFPFGVASGDPQTHSVVLWTRLWHPDFPEMEVNLQVSTDSSFTFREVDVWQKVTREDFYNAKTLAEGLKSGTTYYYRFCTASQCSPVGRTRTASETDSSLSFVVVSCSNYEWGHFNAYRLIAQEQNIQAVIHLGDYIYEYGPGKYGDQSLPRKHVPAHEILSRRDYETRYAQYRLDADLAEAHRMHPFITVWDDHEIANDTYVLGAENHQPESEGSWELRKAIAKQVYFAWLPVRESENKGLRRKLAFGNMADLFMLDGRLEGRTKQASSAEDSSRFDSNRSMLGLEQEKWLLKGIAQSTARWKLIGNQVIFSSYRLPEGLAERIPKSMDMWEGYPLQRDRIAESLQQSGKKNLLVFTGDVHASFAFELRTDLDNPQTAYGQEWVTPSISSANMDEYLPKWKVKVLENKLKKKSLNPHARHMDLTRHGYLRVDLQPNVAKGTWHYVEYLDRPSLRTQKPFLLEYRLP